MGKREQILQTALKLFTAQGIDKTPTSQISKEAGVASGTLFYYFSSKEELINSLYLYTKESMIQIIEKGVMQKQSLRDKIKCLYNNFISWAIYNKVEYLFFLQFCNSSYISAHAHEEGLRKVSFLTGLITNGIQNKELKDLNLDFFIQHTTCIFTTAAQYFIKHKNDFENREFLDSAFQFYWDSIRYNNDNNENN